MRTRLTLAPGQNGTKRLVEHYGDRLICVRYRYDEETQKRYKTVELIIEESSWIPKGAAFLVRIAYEEHEVRDAIKAAGGRWDAQQRLWRVDRDTVLRLALGPRIVQPCP